MTREQAIDYMSEWLKDKYALSYKDREVLSFAIQALEQEPCEQIKWERDTAIKQLNELGYGFGEKIEPCEDCISRKALLDAIYQKEYGTDYYDGNMLNIPYIELIKQMPSVKPAERVGRWKNTAEPCMSDNIVCELCGYNSIAKYKYCPNCGARMESEG